MKRALHNIIWIVILVFIEVSFYSERMYVNGLQCFQCSATSDDSACVGDTTLLARTRQNGGTFSKNCTAEKNQRFCVIERSHNRGHLSTFVRDCSDGQTFSFDTITRLQNIAPTNQTTCASFGTSGTVVCLSLCSTDFCNGPQSSAGRFDCSTLVLSLVIISLLFNGNLVTAA